MGSEALLRTKKLTEETFEKMSRLIGEQIGIKMPSAKKVMLESRLQKRLRALGLDSFEEYYQHLRDSQGRSAELIEMINAVTTNKTDFFREPDHYVYLTEKILPSLKKERVGVSRPFQIWSAGCSSGEEPYTMAMVLEDFNRDQGEMLYTIDASDISMKVLNMAVGGIYALEKTENLPLEVKKRYMLKGKGNSAKKVKIKKELSRNINFFQFNLMEEHYQRKDWYDVVFCRNVLIYFERERQERIIRKLIGTLRPGGFLFLGHSESITGMTLPLETLDTTIYQKRENR